MLLSKRSDGGGYGSGYGYSPLFAAFECGDITPAGFYRVLTNALGCARQIDYETFACFWSDIFDQTNTQLDKLLAQLPQEKYLLSNTNRIVYERRVATCGIVLNHFPLRRNQILSFEVGSIKPEPTIYKVALMRANVKPANALFIDDMPENIDAWRALGGYGIVYHAGNHSIGKLRKELRLLGVLQ